MIDHDIQVFRQFNRWYTSVIGTLDESLLQSGFSLTEARVLYELASGSKCRASEIARELRLDPGYLSRLIAKLERAGLLQRRAVEGDARADEIVLTRKGKSEFRKLDQTSDAQARGLLETLAPQARSRLVGAMQTLEQVLAKDVPPPFVLRPHRAGDMGWVVHREAAVYAEEFGFDASFETLVARIVADFLEHFEPEKERCWMAESAGESLGHVFLVRQRERPAVAKLRLLLVEKAARGRGLGRALVRECVAFSRQAGYRKIELWTQSFLLPARKLYQDAGFVKVREEANQSFGKALVSETWELDLRG